MITIVTDSTSYLKYSEAVELGVRVVPINYTVDGSSFLESYSDNNEDLDSLLSSNKKLTTSHPNMAAFLSVFEDELSKGNDVLCITISSRLSGAFGTAQMAEKQTDGGRVVVFDSQFTGGGLYLLIKEARKLIDGGAGINDIAEKLSVVRDKITVAFSVDDMTQLRNSGRMGFVRRSVVTMLNIKPILLCKDGAVVSDAVAHGSTEIIKKLAEKVNANTQEAVVSAIGDNRMATNLYHVIKESYPDMPITIQKVGPALGIHLGLKVIAIAVIES